ncbi:MAG: GntR family transcriptional regulator [Cytophagales bacterium]|nr:GntR family transcriptional regulator [Cytophagales bacterium]
MKFSENKSIFLQIADNIIEKVMSGVYPVGDKIPSVRELALQVGVNPNTIMRTYNELQSMNIIENKRGIGYFVNTDAQKFILESKRKEFFGRVLPEIIRQAALLGISSDELKQEIDQLNTEAHENE